MMDEICVALVFHTKFAARAQLAQCRMEWNVCCISVPYKIVMHELD